MYVTQPQCISKQSVLRSTRKSEECIYTCTGFKIQPVSRYRADIRARATKLTHPSRLCHILASLKRRESQWLQGQNLIATMFEPGSGHLWKMSCKVMH